MLRTFHCLFKSLDAVQRKQALEELRGEVACKAWNAKECGDLGVACTDRMAPDPFRIQHALQRGSV